MFEVELSKEHRSSISSTDGSCSSDSVIDEFGVVLASESVSVACAAEQGFHNGGMPILNIQMSDWRCRGSQGLVK